jgi:hypothetical protein
MHFKAGNYARVPQNIRATQRAETVKSLSKKIKTQLIEIILCLAGGALAITLSNGTFVYLGAAFMVYAFLIFLPSESDVLRKTRMGEYLELADHMGPLFARAFVKLLFYFLIILQFFMINQPVLALITTFFAYFSMPTYYKTSRPYNAIEAWFRMFFGVLLAAEMYIVFSSQNALYFFMMMISTFGLYTITIFFELFTNPAASLFFLTAAFFITFPKKVIDEDDDKKVFVGIGIGKSVHAALDGAASQYNKVLGNAVFLGISFIAGLPIIVNWGLWTPFQTVYVIVWIMSLLAGWFSGPDGRPFVGIILIAFSLFMFSVTLPGTVGQAIFGVWWPRVESFVSTVAEPIIPMFEQLQTGMADSWLMLSNPMGYYDQMAKRQQATKSKPKEGGTTKSIEVTRTELFTSVTGELEPALDPLVGTMEVQNQGEFNADYIGLKVWATWRNSTALEDTCTGTFNPASNGKFECSSQGSTNVITQGYCQIGTCDWYGTTYPREIKLVTFIFAKDDWSINGIDNLNVCDPAGCVPVENATYVHGGETVKVNANVSYTYNVNVSIPVEVIEFQTYLNLLQAKEITLQDLTSQYTGGPVKATLWSQRQPIRAGEASLFVASIYNDGGGVIDSINDFYVKIPTELGTVDLVSSNFYLGATTAPGCQNQGTVGDFTVIYCQDYIAGRPIKTGEYKRVSFLVTPPATMSVDRMTRLIIGLANYDYTKTTSRSIAVANTPFH